MSEPRRFHTTMSLGEKRHVTSEGFLVCLDVPMARTGDMLYGPEETPVHSADGVTGVTITRDEDEVFRPDTVLSIIGKPVTNDHPDELVVPGNWAGTAVGHVVSARRGTGADASLLLGDIMICEPQAIQDVLSGKVEVSAGYDADYEETGPGRGRQRNIYYNHLALVDKGRCGPRCAIGDYQPEELDMAVKTKKSVIVKDSGSLVARLRNLMSSGVTVKDADIEEALEKEGTSDDITGSGTEGLGQIHIHMGGGGEKPNAVADDVVDPPNPNGGEPEKKTIEPEVEARFQGIETALKQIAAAVQKLMPEENETAEAEELVEEAPDNVDEKTVVAAKDSAFYVETFAETAQMAEVIVPGIRVPTFDREAKPAKTVDALCKFRKTVLDLAYARPDTQALVHDLAGGKKLDTKCMTCDKVRNTFRALFVAKRNSNNESATRDMRVPNSGGAVETTSPIKSIGDLTKFLAEKHKKSA